MRIAKSEYDFPDDSVVPKPDAAGDAQQVWADAIALADAVLEADDDR